jgi:hypothetical protein
LTYNSYESIIQLMVCVKPLAKSHQLFDYLRLVQSMLMRLSSGDLRSTSNTIRIWRSGYWLSGAVPDITDLRGVCVFCGGLEPPRSAGAGVAYYELI